MFSQYLVDEIQHFLFSRLHPVSDYFAVRMQMHLCYFEMVVVDDEVVVFLFDHTVSRFHNEEQ